MNSTTLCGTGLYEHPQPRETPKGAGRPLGDYFTYVQYHFMWYWIIRGRGPTISEVPYEQYPLYVVLVYTNILLTPRALSPRSLDDRGESFMPIQRLGHGGTLRVL